MTFCAFSRALFIRLFIAWERRGWIKATWGTSENNRRAKYYELTKTGQRQLATEQDAWEKMTAAVAEVLRAV